MIAMAETRRTGGTIEPKARKCEALRYVIVLCGNF